MLPSNFGQEALESAPPVGRTTALALIVVDDHDAIPRPPQGDGMVGEGILPFPRFPVIEDLLRVGLADVDDGESVEVRLEDLGRSQAPGQPGRVDVRSSADVEAVRLAASSTFTIDLLPGERTWQLVSDDATERQERPIAIGLGEGFPEPREENWRAGLHRGGGLVGTGSIAWRPSVLRLFQAEAAPIGQPQERRNADYGVPLRGSTRLYFRGNLFASSAGRSVRAR